jgi:hypothetical protein
MCQNRDEPVRAFCARLMGQANMCKYSVKCLGCNTDVDYTNQLVRDCVTRGLSDDDIHLDILGNENQDMELDKLVAYIESKEAGKRSVSRLISSQGIEATRSLYKKQQSTSLQDKTVKCSHCRQQGHGDGDDKQVRREKCPVYGQTCKLCGWKHHFASVCRSKK